MERQRTPLNKAERWSLLATVLCGIFLLAAPIWRFSRPADTPLVVPSPTLPVPNAFDLYTQAAMSMTKSREISYAILPPRPQEQVKAQNLTPKATPVPEPTPLGGPPPGWKPTVKPPPLPIDRNYTLAEKTSLLSQNNLALGTLRQAFKYECWNPPQRSYSSMFAPTWKLRSVAQLLALESQVYGARGQWYKALNSVLDGIRFGSDLQRGGATYPALIGSACQNIARPHAWRPVRHLSKQQTQTAIVRLQQVLSRRVSLADVLREEKWYGQAAMTELMNSPDWHQQIMAMSGSGGPMRWSDKWTLMFLDKRVVLNNYIRYMDAQIAEAQKPYTAGRTELPMPTDPINRALQPMLGSPRWQIARDEAENKLLLCALALQAYRSEQGRFPDRLAQLAPRYLKSVPRDPLARDGAFRYKPAAARNLKLPYLLYSVGPDGNDDGGRAIVSVSNRNMWRERIDESSVGDIVVGISTNRE